jgi:hypothetical protein
MAEDKDDLDKIIDSWLEPENSLSTQLRASLKSIFDEELKTFQVQLAKAVASEISKFQIEFHRQSSVLIKNAAISAAEATRRYIQRIAARKLQAVSEDEEEEVEK